MNTLTSIGHLRSRLFGDPETRRRRRSERAEELWRARFGGWRDVGQRHAAFPGPGLARQFPHRVPMLALALSAVLALGAMSAAGASAQSPHLGDGDAAVTCRQDVRLAVALSSGQPASYTVSGELCSTAAERRDGRTVQLLIPGATYDHRYWDFGTSTVAGTRTRAMWPLADIRRSRSTCPAPARARRRRVDRSRSTPLPSSRTKRCRPCAMARSPGSGSAR